MKGLLLSFLLCSLWPASLRADPTGDHPLQPYGQYFGPYDFAARRVAAGQPLALPTIPAGATIKKLYHVIFSWYAEKAAPESIDVTYSVAAIGKKKALRMGKDSAQQLDHATYVVDVTDSAASWQNGVTHQKPAQPYDSGSMLLAIYEQDQLPWQELTLYFGTEILGAFDGAMALSQPTFGESSGDMNLLIAFEQGPAGKMSLNNSIIYGPGAIWPMERPSDDPFHHFAVTVGDQASTLTLTPSESIILDVAILRLRAPTRFNKH